jgi:D-alanyl-D-alanine carboxypeptidase
MARFVRIVRRLALLTSLVLTGLALASAFASAQVTPINAQQTSAPAINGARTLVGFVSYPRRGVRSGFAVGPVNGNSGAPATQDTTFRIASVTKTYTATATMRLIELGKFSLDDSIVGLLSAGTLAQFAQANIDAMPITVRQLLSHRSGLAEYAYLPEYIERLLTNPGYRWSRAEQLALALAQGGLDAGTTFNYSDTNYILLGEVIERSTGLSLAQSFRQLLRFDALGLRNTYLESAEAVPAGTKPRMASFVNDVDVSKFDASFDLYGGGGLVSTAPEVVAFFRALFAGQIISRTSVSQMTDAVSSGVFDSTPYGLGVIPFFIGNHACFGHIGFGSIVAGHCPSIDFTFAYAGGSDQIPELELENKGIGYRVAARLGIDVRPAPYQNDFERTRCGPELQSTVAKTQCGWLAVAQTRERRSSRLVRFPVVIAGKAGPANTADPILLLGGGPGDALLPNFANIFANSELLEKLVANQNVIAVEYRGVGRSKPGLNCATVVVTQAQAEACIASLQQQGVDLGRYNSAEFATDLEQLRTSLGITQWNVLGNSYGTRAALTMLRDRPRTIRTLTLDGLTLPTSSLNDADEFAQTLDAVFASCAADMSCNAAFPNLRARFMDSMRLLNSAPLILNGSPASGDYLINTLTVFQGDPNILRYLPAVLDLYARRDVSTLSRFITPPADLETDFPSDANFSGAMFLSVQCNELVPFLDRGQLQAQINNVNDPIRRARALLARRTADLCAFWPAGRPSNRENIAVAASVPTLIFNGEFDLQTAPGTARSYANRNPMARVIEFPAIGHIALQQSPECAAELLTQFVVRRDTRALDTRCINDLPTSEWKTVLDAEFFALF